MFLANVHVCIFDERDSQYVSCPPPLHCPSARQINLIAPPRYVMTTTTLERTEGLSVLNQAMAAIKEKIEEKRGVFNIQMEVSFPLPRLTSGRMGSLLTLPFPSAFHLGA